MTNRKRLLIVGNFLSSSGLNKSVCEELAPRLEAAGWRVVTTSSCRGRVLRLLDMLATIWRTRNRYEVAQIDVFSGPSFLWAEATAWLLRRLKKPYVLTLHGGSLPDFARRWPKRVGSALSSASAVTTPSRYLQEQMRLYHDDLILLPNPIDISAYSYVQRDTPRPRLVWLRAFHAIYNPALAASVIARLRDEFPEVHLTMVGPDKRDGSLAEFQAAVRQLDIEGHVRYADGVPKGDVPGWLNSGHIFLNTTSVDNTPVSVIEAMACGLCVVSTAVGGIPYLLEDGCDALLVPPDDPAAMADAVRHLLTEPGLAAHLSRNARAKAEQFDWSIVLPQWERLLLDAQSRN